MRGGGGPGDAVIEGALEGHAAGDSLAAHGEQEAVVVEAGAFLDGQDPGQRRRAVDNGGQCSSGGSVTGRIAHLGTEAIGAVGECVLLRGGGGPAVAAIGGALEGHHAAAGFLATHGEQEGVVVQPGAFLGGHHPRLRRHAVDGESQRSGVGILQRPDPADVAEEHLHIDGGLALFEFRGGEAVHPRGGFGGGTHHESVHPHQHSAGRSGRDLQRGRGVAGDPIARHAGIAAEGGDHRQGHAHIGVGVQLDVLLNQRLAGGDAGHRHDLEDQIGIAGNRRGRPVGPIAQRRRDAQLHHLAEVRPDQALLPTLDQAASPEPEAEVGPLHTGCGVNREGPGAEVVVGVEAGAVGGKFALVEGPDVVTACQLHPGGAAQGDDFKAGESHGWISLVLVKISLCAAALQWESPPLGIPYPAPDAVRRRRGRRPRAQPGGR